MFAQPMFMNIIDNNQTTFLTLFYILDNLLFTHETSSIGGSFPSRLHKGILYSIMGIFIPYNGKLKFMAKKFIIWLIFFFQKVKSNNGSTQQKFQGIPQIGGLHFF